MSWVREDGYTLDQALESVGKGWHPFIRQIFTALPPGCKIVQVKEKFGGLRVYYDRGTPEFHDLVDALEVDSFSTCELCGASGETSSWGGYWYLTLCPAHGEEKAKEIQERKVKK